MWKGIRKWIPRFIVRKLGSPYSYVVTIKEGTFRRNLQQGKEGCGGEDKKGSV